MTANELLDTQKILTDEKLKRAQNPGKYTQEWEVELIRNTKKDGTLT